LPVVAAWAREEVGGVGGIDIVDDDVRDPPRDSRLFDVALVSHVLHDLGDGDAARLLAGTVARLRPGGQLVVFELAGDAWDAGGPFFDLMMRVEGPGSARTPAQVLALLRAAGVQALRALPSTAPHLLVAGRVAG
jgi:SAM-dependent methyltransferase